LQSQYGDKSSPQKWPTSQCSKQTCTKILKEI
jgi:hypothetical protein